MGLFDALASGTEVEVDTALLPTFRLNVADTASAPPGLLSKLVDARVTVFVGGQRVFPSAPYPPREWNAVPFLVAGALLTLVAWRLAR